MRAGQPTAIKNAREVARDAIANHEPVPLPPATLDTLKAIIAEADQRLTAKTNHE